MKNGSSLLTYVAALVVGILLLVFSHNETLSNSIIIAIGLLFLIPGAVMLISAIVPRRTSANLPARRGPWYMMAIGIISLILGIWMLVMPAFFLGIVIYTLGAVLILCGIAAMVFVVVSARPGKALAIWYVIPALTLCAGIVICILGPHATMSFAAIFSGCFLICYAAGGIACVGREAPAAK